MNVDGLHEHASHRQNMNSIFMCLRFQQSIFSNTIFLDLTMPNEKSEQCQLVHESLSAVRLFMKIVTGSLFFFFGRLSRALRNITDELFVLNSFALQWHVTTKEEKRFTLAINNNESTRSMCLVTDIPHFPLFIFLTSPVLVCIQPEPREWSR